MWGWPLDHLANLSVLVTLSCPSGGQRLKLQVSFGGGLEGTSWLAATPKHGVLEGKQETRGLLETQSLPAKPVVIKSKNSSFGEPPKVEDISGCGDLADGEGGRMRDLRTVRG